MATTISFGLQKGGVGKSTVTAITSYLLSKKYKVLAIDFDSQGNLTRILTQESIYDFRGRTIYEAIQDQNIEKCIYPVDENLHVAPAEDLLAYLPNRLQHLYGSRVDQLQSLSRLIDPVKDRYDYILIDLAPSVGDHTLCGLVASDYAVVVLQTEPLSYEALEKYLETMELVQEESNPDLSLAGILASRMNRNIIIDKTYRQQLVNDFGDIAFSTTIYNRTRLKEFSVEGIKNQTKADREVLEPFEQFLEELLDRVKS